MLQRNLLPPSISMMMESKGDSDVPVYSVKSKVVLYSKTAVWWDVTPFSLVDHTDVTA